MMMFATAGSLCKTYAAPYLQEKPMIAERCCFVSKQAASNSLVN